MITLSAYIAVFMSCYVGTSEDGFLTARECLLAKRRPVSNLKLDNERWLKTHKSTHRTMGYAAR